MDDRLGDDWQTRRRRRRRRDGTCCAGSTLTFSSPTLDARQTRQRSPYTPLFTFLCTLSYIRFPTPLNALEHANSPSYVVFFPFTPPSFIRRPRYASSSSELSSGRNMTRYTPPFIALVAEGGERGVSSSSSSLLSLRFDRSYAFSLLTDCSFVAARCLSRRCCRSPLRSPPRSRSSSWRARGPLLNRRASARALLSRQVANNVRLRNRGSLSRRFEFRGLSFPSLRWFLRPFLSLLSPQRRLLAQPDDEEDGDDRFPPFCCRFALVVAPLPPTADNDREPLAPHFALPHPLFRPPTRPSNPLRSSNRNDPDKLDVPIDQPRPTGVSNSPDPSCGYCGRFTR